jgi:hypothetical protein
MRPKDRTAQSRADVPDTSRASDSPLGWRHNKHSPSSKASEGPDSSQPGACCNHKPRSDRPWGGGTTNIRRVPGRPKDTGQLTTRRMFQIQAAHRIRPSGGGATNIRRVPRRPWDRTAQNRADVSNTSRASDSAFGRRHNKHLPSSRASVGPDSSQPGACFKTKPGTGGGEVERTKSNLERLKGPAWALRLFWARQPLTACVWAG